MPHAYLDRAQQQRRIIDRVVAGETVAAICAGAGMPCAGAVQVWRRKDAGFAAELAAARRRGDWMRRLAFDEAKASALLAGLAAGTRLGRLLGKPGMPTLRTYTWWRRTQVGFQADLWAVQQARLKARHDMRGAGQAGGGGRPYRGFDQAVADRILVRMARGEPMRRMLETDPSLPCRAVVYRWRAEHPEWNAAIKIAIKVGRFARERARTACTPEFTDAITDRIVMGASLRSLGAEPDMPCPRTLYAWVARWPKFAAEVASACDWREDRYNDLMVDICRRNGPLRLTATKRQAAPLQLRVNQLAKRPGWKRAAASGRRA